MLGFVVLVIGALVIVSRRKSDGEWRRRWGDRSEGGIWRNCQNGFA